jgi:rRNA biogenesis protein RRP5
MKIFGQITAVHPLALIVSLPNQLFGHVPIINISPQLTQRLENMQEEEEETGEEEEEEDLSAVPELSDLFKPGQYVRAVVTVVHASGTTDALGLSKSKDDATRMSRRIELSLSPDKVNDGVLAADLRPGFVCFLHCFFFE